MTGEQTIIQVVTETMPVSYWVWTSVVVPIVIAWFGYKKAKLMMKDKKK